MRSSVLLANDGDPSTTDSGQQFNKVLSDNEELIAHVLHSYDHRFVVYNAYVSNFYPEMFDYFMEIYLIFKILLAHAIH